MKKARETYRQSSRRQPLVRGFGSRPAVHAGASLAGKDSSDASSTASSFSDCSCAAGSGGTRSSSGATPRRLPSADLRGSRAIERSGSWFSTVRAGDARCEAKIAQDEKKTLELVDNSGGNFGADLVGAEESRAHRIAFDAISPAAAAHAHVDASARLVTERG